MQALITTHLPPLFAPEAVPCFAPHLTLTSGLPRSLTATEANRILDSIKPSPDSVRVAFSGLIAGYSPRPVQPSCILSEAAKRTSPA